jgi:hypothetical protein
MDTMVAEIALISLHILLKLQNIINYNGIS